jgi:hypothetical protein
MNYRAIFAMIKIADQIGQTDPDELAAKMHMLPTTHHLPPSVVEFLSNIQARAKAMHRERPLLINTAQGYQLRRPDWIDVVLHHQRTRSRMNQEMQNEEFASSSQ